MVVGTACLCRVNSECATGPAALAIKVALTSATRREGQIKVQATGIARRRQVIAKGSKIAPTGCPSKIPALKRVKKAPHFLQNGVR